MFKTGIKFVLILFYRIFIPVFVICSNITMAQLPINHRILFDDFDYSSIDYPADGDSSGSIFGKNKWLTENGIIHTAAWRRFNRENLTFADHATIKNEDYGFSLHINKGYKLKERHPMIVSAFHFKEGSFAAKVRFNKINFDTQFIQAFWLNSPLYFRFDRKNEIINYWSEIDFEFNNYFTNEEIQSVQIGCNNKNGKYPVFAQMDCICNDKNNFISFPKCNGLYKGVPILTGQWYICLFNLDSSAKSIKISMFCDSLSKSGAQIWGANSFEQKNWGVSYDIYDFYPDYSLTSIFSLHMGSKSETALSNSTLDVDWYFYSPEKNLNFDDIIKDIDILRKQYISRINTTGQDTYPDALSLDDGIVYIDGPDIINSCQSYTWNLKSTYARHSSFEIDFKYRLIKNDGPEEWVSVYKPEITLTPRNYHKSLEFISSAFDYWGKYKCFDTLLVLINHTDCELENTKYIVSEPFPNPALLTIQFDYELLEPAEVRISIYDLIGNKVESLTEKHHERGHYTVIFDASNYPSGFYSCVYEINNEVINKKIEIYKGR